jgi:hypothetical protein
MSHCGRWRKLYIDGEWWSPAFGRCLTSAKSFWATVSSLEYKIYLTMPPTSLRLPSVFTTDGDRTCSSPFQWPSSRHIKLRIPIHLRDLSAAFNLIECDIELFEERLNGTMSLSFPNLRRLSVTIDYLLDHTVAPALQVLCVRGAIHSVLPFINKSTCALTQLTLYVPQWAWMSSASSFARHSRDRLRVPVVPRTQRTNFCAHDSAWRHG